MSDAVEIILEKMLAMPCGTENVQFQAATIAVLKLLNEKIKELQSPLPIDEGKHWGC